MSSFERMNGRVFAGRKGPHGNRKLWSRKASSRKPDRRLTMERMESRVMMSANPIGNAATDKLDHLAPALFAGTNQQGSGLATVSSKFADLGSPAIKILPSPINPYNFPPAAPTLTATVYSASQISLAWNGVFNATTYLVDEWVPTTQVWEDAIRAMKTIPSHWQQIDSVGSNITNYAATTGFTTNATSQFEVAMSPSTTYTFQVAAQNQAGTTWSNSASATTSVAVDHPMAATAYKPASGTLWGKTNEPSYLDVQQGGAADCWLLVSLAEVAARDPQDIKSMFTPAGSTTADGVKVPLYKVRFFDSSGTARYVTVDTELPGGGTTYDNPVNGVLWAALAEKAYAQANGAGYVTTADDGVEAYAALDHDAANNLTGGNATWALQAITANSPDNYAINPSDIATAWNAGKLIVLATGQGKSAPVSPDILAWHAYAVVNCTTPAKDQAKQPAKDQALPLASLPYTPSSEMPFVLFNPHGATSTGYAPDGSIGLFTANSNFLSKNYVTYFNGTGAAAGAENGGLQTRTHLTAETAADLALAGWGT